MRRSAKHLRLKAATQAAHDRLDRSITKLDIASRRGYAAYLYMNVLALRSIDTTMGIYSGAFASGIAQLIKEASGDLNAIGYRAPAAQIGPQPRAASSLGTAYVVSGSRLGARLLKRQVLASDEVCVRQSVRFITSKSMDHVWPGVLCRLRDGDDCEDAVAKDAIEAFALFENSLVAARDLTLPDAVCL